MPLRDRERDKEFQLELLGIQMKHEREVVFYSVGMAVGASFLIFALTLGLTVVLSEKEIPVLWTLMIFTYLIVGGILLFASAMLFAGLKLSERKDLERIKKKYLDW